MPQRRKILLTRPYADSMRLADKVIGLGLEPVIAPVMEIVSSGIDMPEDLPDADGLMITSANAVRFLPELPAAMYQCSVFTIGDKTFETAQKSGFKNIFKAEQNSHSLTQLIKEYNPNNPKKICHISGVEISPDLKNNLAKENIPVKRWPVYKAEKKTELPPDVIQLLQAREIGCVIFYSARTARIFEELCDFHGLKDCLSQTRVLCLAPSVVKSLNAAIWGRIDVAPTAHEAAILNKLMQLAEDGEI